MNLDWTIIVTVATVAGTVVAGLIAIIGVFDKQTKARLSEKDDLEQRIRELYKEESKAQDEKISTLIQKVDEQEKKIARVTAENALMKDLLQGKDAASLDFQQKGYLAMNEIAAQSAKMDKVMMSIERLASAIEKHLKVEEKIVTTEKTVTQTKGGEQ